MGGTKYHYNRLFFNTIDTEEKAYWLGFIAADGGISHLMNSMRINLNAIDENHLEKFRISINGDLPIKHSIRKNNDSVYIDMNSQEVCLALLKYGITPHKSLTLDIKFDLIPEELHHHVIRGYFDGDGSINYYTRPPYYYDEWALSFISTEKMLYLFLEYMNLPHKLYTCGNNFRMEYRAKSDIQKAIEYMYKDATIYLDRKYEKTREFLKPSETTKKHPNKDGGIVQTSTEEGLGN